ncbi:MAG: hypothetical protein Q4C35_03490 [Eubacteriales bacterium]|nr:hypothetical protein [Eubacteriales bacterium]
MKKLCLFQSTFLVLLLLSLAFPALAHERVGSVLYFGGDYQDTVYEATELPNGNLLLSGYSQQAANGSDAIKRQTRAWLLCLEPGGETAWEYHDDTQGTTRYVLPVVQPDGRITVLFYNSPSQVTQEIAIHSFSQDGELLAKTPLPLELDLVKGRMANGYVFDSQDEGDSFANESGVFPLDRDKKDYVSGFGGIASLLPTEDGHIVLGRAVSDGKPVNARPCAIARIDMQGHELWRFTSEAYASGGFSCASLLENGGLLCLWSDYEQERQRLLRLNASGELAWELDVPWDAGNCFTPCDEGFVFLRTWQEKTRTHIRFTLINEQGERIETRQCEPLKDNVWSLEMFTWQGEAWYVGLHERSQKRVNDRQDNLELQDVALIRFKDCALAQEE